jgi:PAS domain-containing protein
MLLSPSQAGELGRGDGAPRVLEDAVIDNGVLQRAAALRDGEARLQALLSSLDDLVFELDENGTYLGIWTANDTLLAAPRSELLGRTVLETLNEEIGLRSSAMSSKPVSRRPGSTASRFRRVCGGSRSGSLRSPGRRTLRGGSASWFAISASKRTLSRRYRGFCPASTC